jgi:hypothetical protein
MAALRRLIEALEALDELDELGAEENLRRRDYIIRESL